MATIEVRTPSWIHITHVDASTRPPQSQEFETALKEVVTAKRLSQSKMTSLTEIALKCMEVRPLSSL